MNSKCLKYLAVCAAFLCVTAARAQFLPGEESGAPLKKEVKPVSSVQNLKTSSSAPVSAAQAAVRDRESKKSDLTPFNYSKIDVKDKPKVDIVTITDKNGKRLDEEVILTYMKNFNVYRTPTRQVRCSVRFAVISTYKEKISNVSYELKWPKMFTRLSFTDIMPQMEYYIDYLLFGDGCYTMDKTPNIIVNRCRVKGKAQEDCAASVRWLKFGM